VADVSTIGKRPPTGEVGIVAFVVGEGTLFKVQFPAVFQSLEIVPFQIFSVIVLVARVKK
jgi:hypothetical protein